MIQNYHRELIIRRFIYEKIQQGYTVKKVSDDTYEFQIKTSKLKITEKIHCDNFLTDFVNKENEYPIIYASQFKEKP